MKTMNFKAFMCQPSGTVFSKLIQDTPTELAVKGISTGTSRYEYALLAPDAADVESIEACRRMDGKDESEALSPYFGSIPQESMCEFSGKFLVYEPADVEALIAALQVTRIRQAQETGGNTLD